MSLAILGIKKPVLNLHQRSQDAEQKTGIFTFCFTNDKVVEEGPRDCILPLNDSDTSWTALASFHLFVQIFQDSF